MLDIVRFWRTRLPHWEVRGAAYFVTFRCAGSLPKDVVSGLRHINETLAKTESNSPEFTHLHRKYFQILDRCVDRGEGFAPFFDPELVEIAIRSFQRTAELVQWSLGPLVVMPNHVHLLCQANVECDASKPPGDFRCFIKALKGRSARELKLRMSRTGRVWQEDWFDRWCRTNQDIMRFSRYIRNNPVKAKLAGTAEAYSGYFNGEELKCRWGENG